MNTQSKSLAVYSIIFSLLLSSCATGQVFGPTVTPTPTLTYTPMLIPTATTTFTPTATFTPSATFTPTATSTPEATATPEMKIEICTPENFLEHEFKDVDALFNGKILKALRKISSPFDPSKIKEVPLVNYGTSVSNIAKGKGEITYDKKIPLTEKSPNFPDEASKPFRRYIIGYVVGQDGVTYAILPTEYYFSQRPEQNVWVITLYRFPENLKTNNQKIDAIKVWQNDMGTTPIITNNFIPGTKIADPLVSRTFSDSDIYKSIAKFVNNNNFLPDGTASKKNFEVGGDLSALDGKVFLTKISVVNYPIYK